MCIDKRLYVVLSEVDDQLHDNQEDDQFDNPWSLDEQMLHPFVIMAADGVQPES